MKRDVQDNDKIKRLASLFNFKDRSLEIGGTSCIVTAEDFMDIMGIKDGNEEVEMAPKHTEKPPTELKHEDTMKRAYALYALRDIICAPAKGCLNGWHLDYVLDIGNLKKKQWAKHAIDCLVSGIKTYQNPRQRQDQKIGIFVQHQRSVS
nr:hypothetical protein [Tanacetum cinerariifolium]